ncbi:MAG: hypothetical protein IJ075_00700, partial [Lachnospiraceae bacterium]|nr:hypothetical protein [Lachnospiraceae bacterium]
GSESNTPDVATSETYTDASDTGILGRWYPEYTDYSEYYIQFNEDGSGLIYSDGQESALSYTYTNGVIKVKVSTGGENEFFLEDGKLRSDFDGSLYSRKTTEEQEAEKASKEPAKITDVTGIWYDPTGLSTGTYTFNPDGTGILDWGSGAKPASFTYTVNDGSVNIFMSNYSFSLTIRGDQLDDGDSRYIRR